MKSVAVCTVLLIFCIFFSTGRSNLSKGIHFQRTPVKSQAISNVHNNRMKRFVGRKCTSFASACRCRSKRTIVCDKNNCLQRLPTESMTKHEGEAIINIIISRQKNVTAISATDLSLLTNLRSVRLFGNRIHLINPNAFRSNQMLDRLDLHKNELSYVPSALRHLPHLRLLNLGRNNIKSITSRAFNYNPKLEQLVLRGNKLEDFPGNLPKSLIKLTLSDNLLSTVGDLRYLTKLKVLRLDMNRFTVINSNAFPASVQDLGLCNNMMTSDRSLSFDNLRNLKHLRLSGNAGIKRIHRQTFFRRPQGLKILQLQQCNIDYIEDGSFVCFPRLRMVELAGNKLTTYNPEWFVRNRNLRSLTLGENPWSCNCEFAKQLNELESAFKTTISEKRKNHLSSKSNKNYSFRNDFHNITCKDVDSETQENLGARDPSNSVFLRDIDTSRCEKSSAVWELKKQVCFIAHKDEKSDTTTKSRTATGTTTSTTFVSRKTTTTQRPATTTTETTLKTTTTTKRRPTTTTLKTTTTPKTSSATTIKLLTTTTKTTTTTPKTTTTRQPTTTTTTTTQKPTTTTTTTTQKPTTTTTTTTKPIIATGESLSTTTLATEIQDYERACTTGGYDCIFPFIDEGESHTKCIPHSWYTSSTWCKTSNSAGWDYCTDCSN